jgi:hypothetical protein
LTPSQISKISQALCPAQLASSAADEPALRRAVTETKVSLTTELLFERTGAEMSASPDKFTFLAEFSPHRLFIQHSQPRFPSDAAGFFVPLQNDVIRSVRSEGRLGADIFTLIPPGRECSVQALVMCPRRYEKIDRLVPAPYKLREVRVLVNAKAEGILAPGAGDSAKVMSSILVSSNLPGPKPWFELREGSSTTSAIRLFKHDRAHQNLLPPFIPLSTLPFNAAAESRVDLGTTSGAARTSRKRVNVEVSTIELEPKPNLIVGKSELSVEGGECYLLAQWVDEVV